MALKIYQSVGASGKVIGALAEKGDMAALVAYTGQTGQQVNYMALLQVRSRGLEVYGKGGQQLASGGFREIEANTIWAVPLCNQPHLCCWASGVLQSPPQGVSPSPCLPFLSPCRLQSLMMTNPAGAVSLAKMAIKQVPSPLDVNSVTDLFLQRNMVKEATAFLLEALAGDRPEQAPLQSKLLEINLITNPQVCRGWHNGGGRAGGRPSCVRV